MPKLRVGMPPNRMLINVANNVSPRLGLSQAGRFHFAPGPSSTPAILPFCVYQFHIKRSQTGPLNLLTASRK